MSKLISSPSDYPRAYICDECIAVCNFIIEDDRPVSEETPLDGEFSSHPALDHPLAPDLMQAIQNWIKEESLGKDALSELSEVRKIASRMLSKI